MSKQICAGFLFSTAPSRNNALSPVFAGAALSPPAAPTALATHHASAYPDDAVRRLRAVDDRVRPVHSVRGRRGRWWETTFGKGPAIGFNRQIKPHPPSLCVPVLHCFFASLLVDPQSPPTGSYLFSRPSCRKRLSYAFLRVFLKYSTLLKFACKVLLNLHPNTFKMTYRLPQ